MDDPVLIEKLGLLLAAIIQLALMVVAAIIFHIGLALFFFGAAVSGVYGLWGLLATWPVVGLTLYVMYRGSLRRLSLFIVGVALVGAYVVLAKMVA